LRKGGGIPELQERQSPNLGSRAASPELGNRLGLEARCATVHMGGAPFLQAAATVPL
jgi:hypothetical protein